MSRKQGPHAFCIYGDATARECRQPPNRYCTDYLGSNEAAA